VEILEARSRDEDRDQDFLHVEGIDELGIPTGLPKAHKARTVRVVTHVAQVGFAYPAVSLH
jgi:hypothetical protein